MYRQLTVDSIKSYDKFGLFISNFSVLPPKPNIVKEFVPFRNGAYDFSFINGERTFAERQIEVTLTYEAEDDVSIYKLYDEVVNWLFNTNNSVIKIDDVRGTFRGTVEDISSFETLATVGEINAIFTCYPFKLDDVFFGDDIWDTFNFETDKIEQNEFEVKGTKDIEIFNEGYNVIPTVNCTSNMSINFNNKSFSFNPGDSITPGFIFRNGLNNLKITGTGTIKFIFRKEFL